MQIPFVGRAGNGRKLGKMALDAFEPAGQFPALVRCSRCQVRCQDDRSESTERIMKEF